jgi:hypothetical protein
MVSEGKKTEKIFEDFKEGLKRKGLRIGERKRKKSEMQMDRKTEFELTKTMRKTVKSGKS